MWRNQYTFRSRRVRARDHDREPGIDYRLVTPAFARTVRKTRIYKNRIFSEYLAMLIGYDT